MKRVAISALFLIGIASGASGETSGKSPNLIKLLTVTWNLDMIIQSDIPTAISLERLTQGVMSPGDGADWDPASLRVVTGPGSGTVRVDNVTGSIIYTPAYLLPPGLPPGQPPPPFTSATFVISFADTGGVTFSPVTVNVVGRID